MKVSGPDKIFGQFAYNAAHPATRRSFIARLAGVGIFLLSVGKSLGGGDPEDECVPDHENGVCCCGNIPYACGPGSNQGCCYGMTPGRFYVINTTTTRCCGNGPGIPIDKSCCIYGCVWDAGYGGWYNCLSAGAYDPAIKSCCPGRPGGIYTLPDPAYPGSGQGCCDNMKVYMLGTYCCCGKGDGTVQPCAT